MRTANRIPWGTAGEEAFPLGRERRLDHVNSEAEVPFGVSTSWRRCTGDCNGDGAVLINELVLGVGIALGDRPLSTCPAFDVDDSLSVQVNELIAAVGAALDGCPAAAAGFEELPTGVNPEEHRTLGFRAHARHDIAPG